MREQGKTRKKKSHACMSEQGKTKKLIDRSAFPSFIDYCTNEEEMANYNNRLFAIDVASPARMSRCRGPGRRAEMQCSAVVKMPRTIMHDRHPPSYQLFVPAAIASKRSSRVAACKQNLHACTYVRMQRPADEMAGGSHYVHHTHARLFTCIYLLMCLSIQMLVYFKLFVLCKVPFLMEEFRNVLIFFFVNLGFCHDNCEAPKGPSSCLIKTISKLYGCRSQHCTVLLLCHQSICNYCRKNMVEKSPILFA